MTRKLVLTVVLMLSLTMVSCGTNKTTVSDSANNSSTTSQEDSKTNSTSSQDNKKEDTNKENDNKTSSKTDNEIKFSIYKIDENSLEPNEVKSISINKDKSLNDKLAELAKAVSDTNFNGLPIEIKSVDTVSGKKIATINLADSGSKTWVPNFQGSTGGQVTANALIENFLQTNNKSNSEWIDGVKFLYNNETIEYDHVSDLSNVQYRN